MTARMDNGNDLSQCENGRSDKHKRKKERRESNNRQDHHPKENGKPKQSKHCHRHHSSRSKAESVVSSQSTDSEIRFTRKKLGDNQRCGCALIAAFLVILLLAATIFYIGYAFLRPDPLPNRTFQGKFTVIEGERWIPAFANQNSPRFKASSRDYKERINLVVRKSDLKESFEGCEILALDGKEENDDLTVLFAIYFEPYAALVSAAELHAILMEEIISPNPRYFINITIDSSSLEIREISRQRLEDLPGGTTSSPLGVIDITTNEVISTPSSPMYHCEPLKLHYCQSMGYNMTTYPNYLGHATIDDVQSDVIAFRELVDAECYRQAFDFVCRLLQPPCIERRPVDPMPQPLCREYCQSFWAGCGDRIPLRFRKYLDCEKFPESNGVQSCQNVPGCVDDLQSRALSSRLCDGFADCPDLTDEMTCKFCPPGSLYCGRGRTCIPKIARCDGKIDCPDGSDEKDCLSITPMVSYLTNPEPLLPHRSKFFSEGFAVFTEKGTTGKLCAEGMSKDTFIRKTIAESLCKALGYERVAFSRITNDTEIMNNYVRVLDPKAAEISFVRTPCHSKEALYVSCENLECGVQSAGSNANALSKMAMPGDWAWHVALFRAETHVCDGTLISPDWVLTTDSCFQGQSKAIWMAVLGSVRLSSTSPWTQRRRVVGMVKSPVEGSTAALIRLESPVTFSDFVRPVCLPDDSKRYFMDGLSRRMDILDETSSEPRAEKFEATQFTAAPSRKVARKINENTQYFIAPTPDDENLDSAEKFERLSADMGEKFYDMPKAEAVRYNETEEFHAAQTPKTMGVSMQKDVISWTNCNTLGWSRQRDHLQRVQLKIGDMGACENISIATVNSICTEAVFHKMDCTEEEFAGSSVVCLIPDTKRWAIVAVAPWRIACAPTGVERPRMYDKISSNTEWIRSIITSGVDA